MIQKPLQTLEKNRRQRKLRVAAILRGTRSLKVVANNKEVTRLPTLVAMRVNLKSYVGNLLLVRVNVGMLADSHTHKARPSKCLQRSLRERK